jgi:Peptidase family M41
MTAEDSIDEEGTAYHEAGHAVVGAVRGRAPIFATIIPDGAGAVGKTEFPKDWLPEYKTHFGDSPEKRTYIETRILTSVAGTIAHDLRFPGRAYDAADANDDRISRELIEDNAGWADNYRDTYLKRLQGIARGLLQANWPWVEGVARALFDRKTISTDDIIELRSSK